MYLIEMFLIFPHRFRKNMCNFVFSPLARRGLLPPTRNKYFRSFYYWIYPIAYGFSLCFSGTVDYFSSQIFSVAFRCYTATLPVLCQDTRRILVVIAGFILS